MATDQHRPFSLRDLPLRAGMPYVLLGVACALSVGAYWYVSSTASAEMVADVVADQRRFETEADKVRQEIEFRLTTYIEVVRAGAALIRASSEINGAEFRGFVQGLQVRDRYPGMVGIGFAPLVGRNLRGFLRAVTLDSARTFRIWPSDVRPVNYPVLFLEPVDATTRRSIGFNLSTDPLLLGAIEQARDTGQPIISNVTDTAPIHQPGRGVFVLLIPVYRPRLALDTVEGRRRAITGIVFSPMMAGKMLEQLVASTSGAVSLGVYDNTNTVTTTVLGNAPAARREARFESTGSIDVANRKWLVVVRSLEAPLRISLQTADGTLMAGLALSLLLFFITRTQVRAWETAARQEAELRASTEALRESEARAQAADRAKDEFLATLSHELRTPLNAILGWVTMLRRGSIGEDKRTHGLLVIERNARLQAHLIEDLLDVSRILMGKVRLEMRCFPLGVILSEAVESLRPSAEAKSLHLHTSFTIDAAVMRGDPNRIQQIVWNLVANAIKFTPARGHVYVESSADEGEVHIAVRDTGIGIEAEFLPHVFERFRQADGSTTRPHAGIGIGLWIVHHLVELHGGSIEVRSQGRDHGAEFLIHFPLVASASATAVALPSTLPTSMLVEGVRVLVVDDDPDTRELLTEVLSGLGAKVTSVGSARHALERLTTDGADIVLSDIAMPEEDGLSLIRRIRDLPGPLAHVPAIALTAFARAGDQVRAIEAGYQLHLTKPVELAVLQAGLAALTGPMQSGTDSVT